jgi:hypothetical protein
MRISNLIESHSHEGRRLLRESCDGLTESKRVIASTAEFRLKGILNGLKK